jgi:hypoxanthine phosphoribosyltransferase
MIHPSIALDRLQKQVLISEDALQARIAALGAQISQDYAGKDLLLVCILRGGVVFLTDLMRHISVPHQVDFMSVASYDKGARASTGSVRVILDLRTNITDLHVLVIEDIIDSGHTLKNVLEMLSARKPASLQICSLLDKFSRREVAVPLAYIGFQIEDRFVFGYGLDVDEYWRNLPYIAEANADAFVA